jgi:hypothetical protein
MIERQEIIQLYNNSAASICEGQQHRPVARNTCGEVSTLDLPIPTIDL